MLNREDIKMLLEEASADESLLIRYDGFIGRGINGSSNLSECIKTVEENMYDNLVKEYDGYEEKINTYIRRLSLRVNYIKATFLPYKKRKNDNDYIKQNEYTVIIPYDRISSIEIRKVKK